MISEISSKYPHMFSPIKIGNLYYRNRLCASTLGTVPTHTHISSTDYGGIEIADKAKGGLAMIGVCCHGTKGASNYEANGADLFADKYALDILDEQLSVVRAGGALAAFDVGMSSICDGQFYTPSGLPFKDRPAREFPEELILSQVEATCQKALSAKQFGFDSIILDICTDSVVAAFMAPRFNRRADRWGGSYENRFRLAKLLVERVRETVGPDYVIELRVSKDLVVEGTYPFEEMLCFLGEIRDKINIVNLWWGMDEYWEGNVKGCPTIFEPHCNIIGAAKTVREQIPELKVAVGGGIMTAQECEYVIREGYADLILLGRSLLADPYWVKKVMEGREEDVVPCLRCQNCYHIATQHKHTRCSVNPRLYRENRVPLRLPRTDRPKKVVIVGAGPAGAKAALTAAEAGHHVILLEKTDKIGGLLNYAANGELKIDLKRYLDYLNVQIRKAPMDLRLNTPATRELVRSLAPDALIIAAGSSPKALRVKGAEFAVSAVDYLARDFKDIKDHTVIIGGGSAGCEIAIDLARAGKTVTLVEFTCQLSAVANELYKVSLHEHVKRCPTLTVLLNTETLEIRPDAVLVRDRTDGHETLLPASDIITSVGMRPNSDVIEDLLGIIPETYYVGDCKRVATVMEATNEAYYIAASL